MRKLPFTVQPRRKPAKVTIGNEDVGMFEIERRGYLSVGEKAAFQQVVTQQEGTDVLRKLIVAISEQEGIKVEKAHELLVKLLQQKKMTAKEEEILAKFNAEILHMLQVFQRDTIHSNMVMATVLMVLRVDSDWTFEDTANLDSVIIEQLAELYNAEDAKSMEELSFMSPKGANPEGKQPKESEPLPQ